jgi:Zn-dependent metalloprotease
MERAPSPNSFLYFAASLLAVICMSLAAFAECDIDKQLQAIAALGMQVKISFDRHHIPSSIEGQIASRVSADPVESALAALRTIAPVYCVSAADDFIFSRMMLKPDALGQTDVRINQTYHGLDVVGPSLTVHLTHDSVSMIKGWFRQGISVPTDPVLTSQQASRIALQHVVKRRGINGAVEEVRVPVIFVNDHGEPCLAYPVRVDYLIISNNRYDGGRHLDDVFVDAIAGTLAGVRPLIIRDP